MDSPRLETEAPEIPKYSVHNLPEFRRQIVELVRSRRKPGDLARSLEPAEQSISNWVRQAERDTGARKDGGLTSPGREEVAKLRRENHCLRQECGILAQAAAVGRTRPTTRGRILSESSGS